MPWWREDMCVPRALEWTECPGIGVYAGSPLSAVHHRTMLQITMLTLMEIPGGPCGPGKPGKPGGPATPGTPGCPLCPCNNENQEREGCGLSPSSLCFSASPWEAEGSTTPGVRYSRGDQAAHFGQESPPLLPGHSLVLPTHKGKRGHTQLSCDGRSGCRQAVSWLRCNFMISVSNFKTKQPLPELQTQTTCLPQLLQRYQKPHGHNISFAY